MGLPDNAHATLTELMVFMGRKGSGQDELLRMELALGRASADVDGEGLGSRRLIYRGPVESYNNIAAAQAILGLTSVTIAGPPNSAGRTLVIRKTDPDRSITAGILTVTQVTPALVETFDLSQGDILHGVRFFTNTVTAELSGVVGAAANDTVEIGTSEGYTEYYSPRGYDGVIRPLEWPIRNVVAIHEDSSRVFDVSTLLVVGTDYEIREAGSILRGIARLTGGFDTRWQYGPRVVKGRMSAGYKGPAEVPLKIKGVTLELAAWYVQRSGNTGTYGLTNISDATGNRSFSGPPILTAGMKAALAEYERTELETTAERGWSEVAA